MIHSIEINKLSKKYPDFYLEDINFHVPSGYISGFIGPNGAGKTTVLKLILGIALKDGGDIRLLDKTAEDVSVKENLGVLLEAPYYQEEWTPIDVENAVRPFYKKWDREAYYKYLQEFSLNPNQKFKLMSRGMKIKLGLSVTLSHDAKLLILDEPTSGLDPFARRKILSILQDYMLQADRSILFSTHNTSDLEKIADYITYIDNGKIIYSGATDYLLENCCIVRGGPGELPSQKRSRITGLHEYASGFDGLIQIADIGGFPAGVLTEQASIEDIMVYLGGGQNG